MHGLIVTEDKNPPSLLWLLFLPAPHMHVAIVTGQSDLDKNFNSIHANTRYYSESGCVGMSMCCEKKITIG